MMVDTCPLNDSRVQILLSIDERLTDPNFPETIIDALLNDMKPLDPEYSKSGG